MSQRKFCPLLHHSGSGETGRSHPRQRPGRDAPGGVWSARNAKKAPSLSAVLPPRNPAWSIMEFIPTLWRSRWILRWMMGERMDRVRGRKSPWSLWKIPPSHSQLPRWYERYRTGPSMRWSSRQLLSSCGYRPVRMRMSSRADTRWRRSSAASGLATSNRRICSRARPPRGGNRFRHRANPADRMSWAMSLDVLRNVRVAESRSLGMIGSGIWKDQRQ